MCLAIPGKIIGISGDDPELRMGKVDFGGITKDVNLTYVPDAKVGDYAVVHVGFAISLVDEKEAKKTLGYLKEIGEFEREAGE